MSITQNHRRRATLADVAKLAKVSPSAVSRTFTAGASVSKKTRTRVLKAAEALGFRPNILARSLMTGRSALIALASNAFENPYVMSIINTFTIELQNRNLRPLVFNLSVAYDWSETVALMSQYQIDGIIVASSTLSPSFVENVAKSGIPTVIAFGRAAGEVDISAAFVDNEEGGRIAAREFRRRGYRNLGFIGAAQHTTTTEDRLVGFRDELSRMNARPPAVLYAGEYSHKAGKKAAIEILEKHPKLDALFCADDLIGVGALDAIRFELGRTVPDIGVIGFNDIAIAEWPSYRLSTLRPHTDQVIVNAIDMLEAQIQGGPRPIEKRMTSCQLIERESLRKPAKG